MQKNSIVIADALETAHPVKALSLFVFLVG